MFRLQDGCFRLFRVFGIDVFMHWSWLVVSFLELQFRRDKYSSSAWNVAEYLSIFGIVLLHEFGHALACRQAGGIANRIMLWPLGGIAYVQPPPRPGPVLWSIAAGPLVNVVLLPITFGSLLLGIQAGWPDTDPDAALFLAVVVLINALMLVLN